MLNDGNGNWVKAISNSHCASYGNVFPSSFFSANNYHLQKCIAVQECKNAAVDDDDARDQQAKRRGNRGGNFFLAQKWGSHRSKRFKFCYLLQKLLRGGREVSHTEVTTTPINIARCTRSTTKRTMATLCHFYSEL